jgi:branched-chain amino acid transport system permease protein
LRSPVLSGLFIGALYGLLGLGLSLSWGLLRQISLAHFALAFLAAYLCYQLSHVMDPLATLVIIVPLFALIGVAIQWVFARFRVSPFNSLLVTFGLTVIVEAIIQGIWTADFRKLESSYGAAKFKIGALYVPVPELMTLVAALALAFGVHAVLRHTDLGRALRATAEDGPIAAAFGMNQKALRARARGSLRRVREASPAYASRFRTRSHPSQIYAWIGVVFATVMLGGPGGAIGTARRRLRHRRQRVRHDGGDFARMGAARIVLTSHPRACC